jgi:hypothetical protein
MLPPKPTGFGLIIDGVRKSITFASIEEAERHAPKGHAEVSMAPFTLAFGSVIAFGSEIVVNVKGPADAGSATPTAQTATAIPMALSERIQATPNRARRECYHTAATNPDLQRKSPANFPRPHIVGRLLTGI